MLDLTSARRPVWRYTVWVFLAILPILGASALPYFGSEPLISSLGDLWGLAVLQWGEWSPDELNALVLALSDLLWVGAWLGLSAQVLIVPSEYRTGWTFLDRAQDARGAEDTLRVLFYRHPELIGLGFFLIGPFAYFLIWMPNAATGTVDFAGGGSIWVVAGYLAVTRGTPSLRRVALAGGISPGGIRMSLAGFTVAVVLGALLILPTPIASESRGAKALQKQVRQSFESYHDWVVGSGPQAPRQWALLNPYAIVPPQWGKWVYSLTHFWHTEIPPNVRRTLSKADSLKIHTQLYSAVGERGIVDFDSTEIDGLMGPVTNRATVTSSEKRDRVAEAIQSCFETTDPANTAMPLEIVVEAHRADTTAQITLYGEWGDIRPSPWEFDFFKGHAENGPHFPCKFQVLADSIYDDILPSPPGYQEMLRRFASR